MKFMAWVSRAYRFFGLGLRIPRGLYGGLDEGLEHVEFDRPVLAEQVADGLVGCGHVLRHAEVFIDDCVDVLEDGFLLFVHEEVVDQAERGFFRGLFRGSDGLLDERLDHFGGFVAARAAIEDEVADELNGFLESGGVGVVDVLVELGDGFGGDRGVRDVVSG